MSGEKARKLKLDRRTFLKVGALGAAATGVASTGMFSFGYWLDKASAVPAEDEQIRYMSHSGSCGGYCSLKCTVRDGRLVMVEPNDSEAILDESVMCLRGISEIQNIYGAGRIQTPLKRVGERGAGEFVPISWDEALDTIEQNIKDIQSNYGEKAFLAFERNRYNWLSAMAGMHVPKNGNIDIGIENGWHNAFNVQMRYWGSAEIFDAENASTLLLVGTNNIETSLALSSFWFKVKEQGTKIISVDPNYTTTVQKSHQWIPIKHGTDAAMFLAMISVVLDNEWYDEAFITKHSSLPFLIKKEDGQFLRERTPDPEDKASVSGETNPFFVWDTVTDSPQPYTKEGVECVLEGSFTYGGVQYITAFSLLKETHKPYTPAWAEGITGIPADTLIELTDQYANGGPAFILNAWGGPDKYTNADICGHAMITLIGLTGNIGRPGSGWMNGYYYLVYSAMLGGWQLPKDKYPGTTVGPDTQNLPAEADYVKGIFASGNVFQQLLTCARDTEAWLETVEFIALVEVFNSTSVQYADIVLPVCSQFEGETEYRGISIMNDRMMVSQTVLEPLFESKTDFEIQKLLCARFGDEKDLPESMEAQIRYQLANSTNSVIKEITLEELESKQYAMTLVGAFPRPYRNHEDQKYVTPSGRMELYYELFLEDNQAFATWEPPTEVYEENPLREQYPLVYTNLKNKYRGQCNFYYSDWINQIIVPEVEVNPVDAEQRSLVSGDIVEVFNDRGSFKMKLRINNSICPGSIRTDQGIPSPLMIEGKIGNVMSNHQVPRSKKFRFGAPSCYHENLVEIRKAGDEQ